MESLHLNFERLSMKELRGLLCELEGYEDNDFRRIYFHKGHHKNSYQIDDHNPTRERVSIHRGGDLPFISIEKWKELILNLLFEESIKIAIEVGEDMNIFELFKQSNRVYDKVREFKEVQPGHFSVSLEEREEGGCFVHISLIKEVHDDFISTIDTIVIKEKDRWWEWKEGAEIV